MPRSDFEHLFEHEEFVRKLAQHLVQDPSRADDIAQQAWVVALTRPSAGVSRPRAWLARVVRNLAINDRRSEARRSGYETLAGREEAGERVDAELLRSDVREQLRGALTSLQATYRDVLVMQDSVDLTAVAHCASSTAEFSCLWISV